MTGGRLLARLHLATTAAGLGFHHMNQITERIDRDAQLGNPDAFSARWSRLIGSPASSGLVSFRIGHSTKQPGLSPRRVRARPLVQRTLHIWSAVVAAVQAMADPGDEGRSIGERSARRRGRVGRCDLDVRPKGLLLYVRVVAPEPADDLRSLEGPRQHSHALRQAVTDRSDMYVILPLPDFRGHDVSDRGSCPR